MLALAQRVKALTHSESPIRLVPYAEVYGSGFEDMLRRTPSTKKIAGLIGWTPRRNLDVILKDVIDFVRQSMAETV